ncbi:hypothetical protein BV898_02163 [Hypsibius exemplaris]|uniref:Receptor ligand binding region domain-containing protein n=1 Tax=Hypsibius exemplaris TaxID=2072580 RepID=A0A1W0X970_HYPEX|nr:hypothetical protein BV898_02163 [Hypsibius exemplaris]
MCTVLTWIQFTWSVVNARTLHIDIITPGSMSTALLGGLPFVRPAFDSALEDIKQDYPSLTVSQAFITANESEECMGENIDHVAEYFYRRPNSCPLKEEGFCWTIFILPGCSRNLDEIQQFGTELNKVVLSSSISSSYLIQKARFPTLLTTSVAPISPTYYASFLRLIRMYNWTTVVVVTDIGGINPVYEIGGRAVFNLLASAIPRIDVTFIPVNLTGDVSAVELIQLLQILKATTRVVILVADSLPSNKLLIQARFNGMTDGSYVYVLVNPLTLPYDGGRQRTTAHAYHFEEARKSYSSCLLVSIGVDNRFSLNPNAVTIEADPFVSIWKERSKAAYNYTYPAGRQPTQHVATSYAAVMVVAQVADELRQHESPFDFGNGALLARQFFGRTFHTKVGDITFDQQGQRVPQTFVGYFDPDKDAFVPFLIHEPQSGSNNFVEVMQPLWPNGSWPVPNQPPCGFQGIGCVKGNMWITIIVVVVVAAVIAISIYSASKRFFLDQRLHELWWNLDADLLLGGGEESTCEVGSNEIGLGLHRVKNLP